MKKLILLFLISVGMTAHTATFVSDCVTISSFVATAPGSAGTPKPFQFINGGDILSRVIVTTTNINSGGAELGLWDSWGSTFTAVPLRNSVLIGTVSVANKFQFDFGIRLSSGLSYTIGGTNPGLIFLFCDENKQSNPLN